MHPYHLALRVLSDAVENLTKACIQLEEGRREVIQKQAMVQEAAISHLVSDPEHKHGVAESGLTVLDGSHDSDSDSEVEDMGSDAMNAQRLGASTMHGHGQLVSMCHVVVDLALMQPRSLKDSLSVVLSEYFTPPVHDLALPAPSPIMSITPPD